MGTVFGISDGILPVAYLRKGKTRPVCGILGPLPGLTEGKTVNIGKPKCASYMDFLKYEIGPMGINIGFFIILIPLLNSGGFVHLRYVKYIVPSLETFLEITYH